MWKAMAMPCHVMSSHMARLFCHGSCTSPFLLGSRGGARMCGIQLRHIVHDRSEFLVQLLGSYTGLYTIALACARTYVRGRTT